MVGVAPEVAARPERRGGRVVVWKTPTTRNNRIHRWTCDVDDGEMSMAGESPEMVIWRSA
jgi:hypothetical protein